MEFLNKIKENKVYRIKTKIMKLIHTKNPTRIKGHALMRNSVHVDTSWVIHIQKKEQV